MSLYNRHINIDTYTANISWMTHDIVINDNGTFGSYSTPFDSYVYVVFDSVIILVIWHISTTLLNQLVYRYTIYNIVFIEQNWTAPWYPHRGMNVNINNQGL